MAGSGARNVASVIVDCLENEGVEYVFGLPGEENLHLIERFTRIAADTIDYEITVSDPGAWTRPWTAVVHLKQSPDRILEYACHEGNDRTMMGMLLGARAAERSSIKGPDKLK